MFIYFWPSLSIIKTKSNTVKFMSESWTRLTFSTWNFHSNNLNLIGFKKSKKNIKGQMSSSDSTSSLWFRNNVYFRWFFCLILKRWIWNDIMNHKFFNIVYFYILRGSFLKSFSVTVFLWVNLASSMFSKFYCPFLTKSFELN